MEAEEWRVIPNYTEYYASSLGRVFSFVSNKLLSQYETRDGYLQSKIDRKHFFVARLVAMAFYGNRDGMVVDHIDHNVINNEVNNLRWVSQVINSRRITNAIKKVNKFGCVGISFRKNRPTCWMSKWMDHGKTCAKYFYTKEEAAQHAMDVRKDWL